jgi:hypothetical protein
VLHPKQFRVNEAWIAFQLNEEPIRTVQDGDFNFLALLDAASCFILGSAPVPAERAEPTPAESRQLLEQGHAHKKRWPKKLFVPTEQPAEILAAEAERLGIEVVRVAEGQLRLFLGDAKKLFREQFGRGTR